MARSVPPCASLSRSGLAYLSDEIAGHPVSELDSSRFPGQNKPDDPNPVGRDPRQQIHNELRIAVSIERALHDDQDKKHGDAKEQGIKVGFPKKFANWNPQLAAHVAGQKDQ